MSDETIEAPRATIYIERKVQVRDYESLTVGIHFPADLPVKSLSASTEEYYKEVDTAIREAMFVAKIHVYEQAGLQYEDKDGVITEMVTAKFAGAVEVSSAAAPQKAAPSGTGHPKFGKCAGCGGTDFWDNTDKKASGQYKPNAADGKCKSKACSKSVWLGK